MQNPHPPSKTNKSNHSAIKANKKPRRHGGRGIPTLNRGSDQVQVGEGGSSESVGVAEDMSEVADVLVVPQHRRQIVAVGYQLLQVYVALALH